MRKSCPEHLQGAGAQIPQNCCGDWWGVDTEYDRAKVPPYNQGGSGTEPEPETGTVGTVIPEIESGTGTAGTVFQEPKPEPSFFLLNCTEIQKKTLFAEESPQPKTGTA